MRYILCALALATSLPASPILMRPDRDDAEYLELATKYESPVPLGADGEGVLIAERWILTAAHRIAALQEMKPVARIQIAGRGYEIQSFASQGDIGLIHLRNAVTSIKPAPLYREADEGGKTVIIAGHGLTGKIGGTPLPKERWDRKKRAAINTVDRVAPRVLGLRIKPPEEASDLQGAMGPGDRGGPAFIETPHGIFVAGIGLATDGDWELYARVSFYVPWIEAVMLDADSREIETLLGGAGGS